MEEVAHKGESMSLCVPLQRWLTVFIHALRGGAELSVTHTLAYTIHSHTHTLPVRQVQRESGKINGGTPSSRLGPRQSEKRRTGEVET